MRILHLGATYPPYHGGMGNVMREQAERLATLGHEVVVATLAQSGSNTTTVENGVTVHRFRAQIRWTRAGLALQMVPLLKQEWDIVHVHVPFFGLQELLACMLWTGFRPAAMVVTYHMDIVASGFVKGVAAISRRFFLPTVLKRANACVVASKSYAASSWLARHPDVLSSAEVLAFGVDVKRFAFGEGSNAETMNLLFVGGLDRNHYFKGLSVAMEALAELRNPDLWSLTVVGDGDMRATFERRAFELGIMDNIQFKGRVEDADLPAYYQGADVLLFPSVDRSEAFGLVAVEAQACGTPVIASDLDGVREVVEDGVTGWLVEPGSVRSLRGVLAHVLERRQEVRAMRKAVHARAVALYDWDAHVAHLETVYKRLCASSS